MNLKKISSSCDYCDSFLSHYSSEPWNQIISETQNFVAVPTLGSILPGWVLIVPKKHIIRLSELSLELSDELIKFAMEVGNELQKSFGKVTLFEHGPVTESSLLGCGINHAHLHVLSSSLNFSKAISNYSEIKYEWEQINSLNPFTHLRDIDAEYLFYWEMSSQALYTKATKTTSQYFRKIIANSIGKINEYNYKEKSFADNVLLTLDALDMNFSRLNFVNNG